LFPSGPAAADRTLWPAAGLNLGYTLAMKTSISIPNSLYQEAERLRKRLGVPRSKLYAQALKDYLLRQKPRRTK